MVRRIFFTYFTLIFLLSFASASQSLGVFQKDTSITLVQGCDDSSYSNISQIVLPNSSLLLSSDVSMTKLGNTYSYVFSETSDIGKYLIYGHCDESGTDTVWVYDLEVTYTGEKVSQSNGYIVLALLFMSAIFLVLSYAFSSEHWILKTFFNFSAVGMGILAINSAKIIASESESLEVMGTVGLTLGIVIMSLFFLYMFVYAFIEIIQVFKQKRGVRFNY